MGSVTDPSQFWKPIKTAPYEREIELAVIEEDNVHSLVFACCRTAQGWINASSKERVIVSPTHWRAWRPQR
ncbi:MAG: hypothetical protein HY242_04845 [Afipia sp.]|nr:hypothetical protein [Afipia sp.]